MGAPSGTAYDSVNQLVAMDAIPQLNQIMNIQEPKLIISKPMQEQPYSLDCGLFALASIVTLLNGENPSDKIYDVTLMQEHFASCLKKSKYSFPLLK